jgi:hypothetical protein
MNLEAKWTGLLTALSGEAVAYFIFETSSWIISFVPFWLIVTDCCLALAALFFLGQKAEARENRRHGFFLLLISFLVFVQILVTPQAGGPHHYSMIFPLPLLAFIFLAQPLYRQLAAKTVQRFAALLLVCAAFCVFTVNVYNLGGYLSHLRANSHYNARLSPEIYSLSQYVNEHGLGVQRVISVDWGLQNQLHALAPRKLQKRMRDCWPFFQRMENENQESQVAALNSIFPEGKSLALTFAASKETFPETRRNFLAALATHPELKSRLVKDFWSAGERIYEVYEIDRSPTRTAMDHAAPNRDSGYTPASPMQTTVGAPLRLIETGSNINFASSIQIARSSSIRLSPESRRGNGEIAAPYPTVDFELKIGPPVECAARASLWNLENTIQANVTGPQTSTQSDARVD